MSTAAAEQSDATELLTLTPEQIGSRITRLLAGTVGGSDVVVQDVRRTFGGNARRAWSFDATWRGGAPGSPLAGIMLVQVENAQVQADLVSEFGVLHGLRDAGVRAPAAIALDATGAVIGAPSMILERLPGAADAVGFLRATDVAGPTAMTRQLAAIAARLHRFDWRAAGLGEFLPGGDLAPEVAARRQVDAWHVSFVETRMEPYPVLSAIYRWLLANVPDPERLGVVHGDFRPGNFLYEDGQITALLDWELAHLGDPVEDVAWAYREFWTPARFVSLTDFVQEYARGGGQSISPSHLRYYRIFTEAKFATISLRAARAFHEGRTSNLRLADRAATVTESVTRCLGWMAEGAGDA